jgi:hypothetical protein
MLETVLNAAAIGLGSGIGSYFGAKIAKRSEESVKTLWSDVRDVDSNPSPDHNQEHQDNPNKK